jgi:hypothetical protein
MTKSFENSIDIELHDDDIREGPIAHTDNFTRADVAIGVVATFIVTTLFWAAVIAVVYRLPVIIEMLTAAI